MGTEIVDDIYAPMSTENWDKLGSIDLLEPGKDTLSFVDGSILEGNREDDNGLPVHTVKLRFKVDEEYGGRTGSPQKLPATIWLDVPSAESMASNPKRITQFNISMTSLKRILVALCGGNGYKKNDLGDYPTIENGSGMIVPENPLLLIKEQSDFFTGKKVNVVIGKTDGTYVNKKTGEKVQGTPRNEFSMWEAFLV